MTESDAFEKKKKSKKNKKVIVDLDEVIENYDNKLKQIDVVVEKKSRKNKTIIEAVETTYYKDKLKVFVKSGQIKELYGKIVSEKELSDMSESEAENIYKICELNLASTISNNVIVNSNSVVGNICSNVLPIDIKEQYTSDLKNDYIINSELKSVAGQLALRTGKLMGVLSFLVITASHVNIYRKTVKEVEHEIEAEHTQEFTNELEAELTKELEQ